MVAPVQITQSVVPLKVPLPADISTGALAVNISDGALYSKRANGTIIRIEGDTGNDSIAAAATIALGAVMAAVVDVTGAAVIAAIVLRDGQTRTVRFSGTSVLVHSASLQLLGGSNVTAAAGDFATFRGYSGGVTRCTNYSFASAPYPLGPAATDAATTMALANSLRSMAIAKRLGS
jgi:hypothetical protein